MIIRIILFRDVPIYAIFKGTFRNVNLIPFYTIYQFIVSPPLVPPSNSPSCPSCGSTPFLSLIRKEQASKR